MPRLFFGNSVNFLENYIASLNLGVVSPSTSINGKNPSHSEPALLQLDAEDMSKKKASWTPTPWRMIKLNVDAGFDANTQHAGLGFVARIHMGEVIFSGWSSNHLCYSAKEVECLAALVGIRRTLSVYKGSIWLESNCLATVQALNDSTTNRSTSCFIIEEAKKMLQIFQRFKVSRCNQSANGVAHDFGQIGRRDFFSVFISEGIPACVSRRYTMILNMLC